MSPLLPDWSAPFTGSPALLSIKRTDATNNNRAVADTVGLMGAHAVRAISSPQVREACREAGIGQRETADQTVSRAFSFIKRTVRFVEDETALARMFHEPDDKELLITPPALLAMHEPAGDCDCFSMLGAALLMAGGVKCGFVTIAANERHPEIWSHVYVMAYPNGVATAFDASHGKTVGWEASRQFRKQVWPIFNWGGRMVLTQGGSLAGRLAGIGELNEDGVPIIDTSGGYGSTPNVYAPSGPPINWNAILPGIFGSSEKIAQQLTQPVGYQMTGPGGQFVSYVAPQGQTGFNVPGFPSLSSGGSSSLLLIGGALLAVVVIAKMAR